MPSTTTSRTFSSMKSNPQPPMRSGVIPSFFRHTPIRLLIRSAGARPLGQAFVPFRQTVIVFLGGQAFD